MTNQEQYERMIIVDNITISDFAKRISDYCNNFDCCADCQFMKKTKRHRVYSKQCFAACMEGIYR